MPCSSQTSFPLLFLFWKNNAFLFYFTPQGLKQLPFSWRILFNEFYKAVVDGRIGFETEASQTIIHHFERGANSTRGHFLGYNTVAILFFHNTVSGEAVGHNHKCADYLKCQTELQTMHFQTCGLLLAQHQCQNKKPLCSETKRWISQKNVLHKKIKLTENHRYMYVFFSKYEYKYIC